MKELKIKKCLVCGKEKPVTEFLSSSGSKYSRRGICKDCWSKSHDTKWEDVQLKKCTVCGKEKPLTEFHVQSSGKYGRLGMCKDCRSKRSKELREGKPSVIPPKEKKCCRCGEVKPRSEFYKEKGRKDGLSPVCKTCKAEYNRRYNSKKKAAKSAAATVPVKEKSSALERQVGGDHYKSLPLQPVEYIAKNNLSFLAGCVVKRISRYNRPGGKGLQDLEKIKHEINLIIELEGWK